jgi:hypothetical protein
MKGRGPVIQMRDAQVKDVVDEAEDALVKAAEGDRVFQRGQELVRITCVDDVRDEHGVRRKAGVLMITPVTQTWLGERLDVAADWRAFKTVRGKGQTWVPASPRPQFIATLLERKAWRFPVLVGLTSAPTLDREGRIIEKPGFDEASGLYLNFDKGAFPPIPEAPTLEDAKKALTIFANPLRAMPWATPSAKSVALSAGLTALVRSSLRTAPLHAFDAPSKGTGKSLCADWVGLMRLGQSPPAMNQGKSTEEDEKRLGAALRAGDQIILIDNCDAPVEGPTICSALTQETVSVRILGLSEKLNMPTGGTTFLASGNNFSTRGDMTRRVVVCRLDSGTERPEERSFDFDVREETRRDRGKLVAAGLTVLRAYIVADRPLKNTLTPFGSFEDWTGLVREALVWCGEADPCASRQALVESDSEAQELIEVMDVWEAVVGDEQVSIAEAQEKDKEGMRLQTKLIEVTETREWNAKRIGWWLRKHKDRWIGKRAFRYQATGHAAQWRLEGAGQPAALVQAAF